MPLLLPIAVAVFLLAVAAGAFYLRRHHTHAKCSNCGAPSQFGYSRQAESERSDIARLCLACLMAKIERRLRQLPGASSRSRTRRGLALLRLSIEKQMAWLQAGGGSHNSPRQHGGRLPSLRIACQLSMGDIQGLLPPTFEQVFSEGPSQTIFKWRPVSLCGPCCLAFVKKAIESRGLTVLEVCGPRSQDGIIIPMGY
jgi:hypothetical protein